MWNLRCWEAGPAGQTRQWQSRVHESRTAAVTHPTMEPRKGRRCQHVTQHDIRQGHVCPFLEEACLCSLFNWKPLAKLGGLNLLWSWALCDYGLPLCQRQTQWPVRPARSLGSTNGNIRGGARPQEVRGSQPATTPLEPEVWIMSCRLVPVLCPQFVPLELHPAFLSVLSGPDSRDIRGEGVRLLSDLWY